MEEVQKVPEIEGLVPLEFLKGHDAEWNEILANIVDRNTYRATYYDVVSQTKIPNLVGLKWMHLLLNSFQLSLTLFSHNCIVIKHSHLKMMSSSTI